MDNSLKILLTINLVGTVGKHQDNLEIIPYSFSVDNNNQPCKEVRGSSRHLNKTVKSCTQNTKLSQDAYDLFISSEVPHWSKSFIWGKMNKLERVRAHCARIAGENTFSFEILE